MKQFKSSSELPQSGIQFSNILQTGRRHRVWPVLLVAGLVLSGTGIVLAQDQDATSSLPKPPAIAAPADGPGVGGPQGGAPGKDAPPAPDANGPRPRPGARPRPGGPEGGPDAQGPRGDGPRPGLRGGPDAQGPRGDGPRPGLGLRGGPQGGPQAGPQGGPDTQSPRGDGPRPGLGLRGGPQGGPQDGPQGGPADRPEGGPDGRGPQGDGPDGRPGPDGPDGPDGRGLGGPGAPGGPDGRRGPGGPGGPNADRPAPRDANTQDGAAHALERAYRAVGDNGNVDNDAREMADAARALYGRAYEAFNAKSYSRAFALADASARLSHTTHELSDADNDGPQMVTVPGLTPPPAVAAPKDDADRAAHDLNRNYDEANRAAKFNNTASNRYRTMSETNYRSALAAYNAKNYDEASRKARLGAAQARAACEYAQMTTLN